MNRRRRTSQTVALACATAMLIGCTERRIFVTSTPPGANVIINDVNVGQTPVEVDFLYYGVYDVRVNKDGYEPVITSEKIKIPPHDLPIIDLAAEALPIRFKKHVAWHYVLDLAERDPDALITRAAAVRSQVSGEFTADSTAGDASSADPIILDSLRDIEDQTPLPADPEPSEPTEEEEGDG